MLDMGAAGAQIPLEDVPSVQKEVVVRCRQLGRPVIVASHLLQSMIEYPTPTRAEVTGASPGHPWALLDKGMAESSMISLSDLKYRA